MTRLRRSKKEIVSYKMSRVRAKGSEIEKIMGSALWASVLRGYRKNQKSVLGTPDFCWKRQKIAVFCDSAFWHGYKNMTTKIHKFKTNKKFWTKKIKRNIERDKIVNRLLKKEGWIVIRFWDFQIKNGLDTCIEKVKRVVNKITPI